VTGSSRDDLYAVIDRHVAALAANDAGQVNWAGGARYSENGVSMPFGDGAWGTVTAVGDYRIDLADTKTGQVCRFGVFEESGDAALFALRLRVTDGKIAESELVAARPIDSGTPFLDADPAPRAELEGMLDPGERTPRARMIELADGYFSTMERNDGTIRTVFTPDCNRRENGTQSTNNPQPNLSPVAGLGCEEQFALGYFRFDNWVRARRYPLVDEERGIVLAGGTIDHSGHLKRYTLTDGEEVDAFFRRPHSLSFLELFRIRNGAIQAIEAVFHFVPYRMPSPWAADEHVMQP
jgi:hypothetical protein